MVEKPGVLCSELSMHGFSHINPGVSNKVKCFWIFIICLACIGTCLHLYSLFGLYLKYGYYETVTTERDTLEMPDITFCNSDAISIFNMHKHQNISIFAMKNVVTALDKWSNSEQWFGETIDPKYFAIFVTYTAFFDNLEYHDALKVSTLIDELVVHCLFQNMNCSDIGQFHLFFHNVFGSCYTFRIDEDKMPDIKPGPDDGLSIILKANHQTNFVYDMINKVTNVNGIKVIIHERGTLPAVLRNAIDITPGMSTNIGLTMKKFDRLNVPYDKCFDGRLFGEQTKFIYSEELCEQNVKFALVKKMCNCTSNRYNSLYKDLRYTENCLYSDFSTSSMLNVLRNMDCIRTIVITTLNSSVLSKELAKCVWPCKQIDYETVISQASWPQDTLAEGFIFNFILPLPCESPIRFYYEQVMKILSNNSTLHAARNRCHYDKPVGRTVTVSDYTRAFRGLSLGLSLGHPMDYDLLTNSSLKIEIGAVSSLEDDWIKKYFYRLNIYFSKPTIEMHTQVISFSLTDLLSSIGGVMSLWSGFSLITLIEIVWILARLVNLKSKTDSCLTSTNKQTPVTKLKKVPDHVIQIRE